MDKESSDFYINSSTTAANLKHYLSIQPEYYTPKQQIDQTAS